MTFSFIFLLQLRHSVIERRGEGEHAPPLPATAPPPADDLSIGSHDIPPTSSDSVVDDGRRARIDQLEAEVCVGCGQHSGLGRGMTVSELVSCVAWSQ